MSLPPPRKPDPRAYAANVSRSHRGWLVSLRDAASPRQEPPFAPPIAGEPLRGLSFDGPDLVLEFGAGPGRARRHVIAGPLELEPGRRGLDLEIRVNRPCSHTLVVRLARPQG